MFGSDCPFLIPTPAIPFHDTSPSIIQSPPSPQAGGGAGSLMAALRLRRLA